MARSFLVKSYLCCLLFWLTLKSLVAFSVDLTKSIINYFLKCDSLSTLAVLGFIGKTILQFTTDPLRTKLERTSPPSKDLANNYATLSEIKG